MIMIWCDKVGRSRKLEEKRAFNKMRCISCAFNKMNRQDDVIVKSL